MMGDMRTFAILKDDRRKRKTRALSTRPSEVLLFVQLELQTRLELEGARIVAGHAQRTEGGATSTVWVDANDIVLKVVAEGDVT